MIQQNRYLRRIITKSRTRKHEFFSKLNVFLYIDEYLHRFGRQVLKKSSMILILRSINTDSKCGVKITVRQRTGLKRSSNVILLLSC